MGANFALSSVEPYSVVQSRELEFFPPGYTDPVLVDDFVLESGVDN